MDCEDKASFVNHGYPSVAEPSDSLQSSAKSASQSDGSPHGNKGPPNTKKPSLSNSTTENNAWYRGDTAIRFLLAGGVAGAG